MPLPSKATLGGAGKRIDRPDRPDLRRLASVLGAELSARSATVSTAESLTGGALGNLLSAAPGSSMVFLGGVICYTTRLKVDLLGVSPETVATHGVVSAECAAQMAGGVRALTGSDFAVATTGVAGPGEQEGKPVGLVYVAVAGPDGAAGTRLRLTGRRRAIRRATCRAAIVAVTEMVVGTPAGK